MIALTALLVLNNLLFGIAPAMTYADELEVEETSVEVEEEEPEEQEAVEVLDPPSLEDASDTPVEEPDESVVVDDGAEPDANAPPEEPEAEEQEAELPEVPAWVAATYRIAGDEERAFEEPAEVVAGDGVNRVILKTDFDAEGEVSSCAVTLLLDEEDVTSQALVAPDASWIDVPSDIDLSRCRVEVSVVIESAAEADGKEPAEPEGAIDDEMAPEEAAPETPLPVETDDEEPVESFDEEAYAEQLEIIASYLDEVGATDAERQAFMMDIGAPLLRSAGTTGTITSIKPTGLGDGITAGYWWTLDGKQAYCMSGFFADPAVGQTLTRYEGSLGIDELDFVLYHGYDGVNVTSVGGLDAMRSIAATQAAVWYVVGDKREDVLDIRGWFHNDNYYNRLYGLNVIDGRQDIFRAAKSLVDGAVAYANAGGGGPEAGFAKVYLNDGTVRNSVGNLVQHMVAVGEREGTLKVVKTSSNPDTYTLSAYSIAGARYGVYSDSACRNLVTTIAIGSDRSGSATLTAGTYYVKETTAGAGYLLDTTVHTATVVAGGTATVSSIEEPEPAKARVKKTSSSEIPSGSSGYSLAGAEYGLYATRSDADADANRMGTFTTKKDGTSNEIEVLAGTYYAKELKASPGFELDTAVHAITVSPGQVGTFTSVEKPRQGSIEIVKVSANPSLTASLSCYSLAGAKYGVYASRTDAQKDTNRMKTIVTNANGKGSAQLFAGSYFVREVEASPGFLLDSTVHSVTVSPGSTGTVKSTEQPFSIPLDARVQKVDKNTGEALPSGSGSLAGAEFMLSFYDNVAGSTSGSPARSWVFSTDESGAVAFNSATPVSGDAFFTSANGTRVFPVGTYTVQETKAPMGYQRDTTVHKQVINANDGGKVAAALFGASGGSIIVNEQVKRGDVRWVKVDGDGNPMAGVEFRITNSKGESIIVATDAEGIFDSSRPEDKAQAWMPVGTEVDEQFGSFPYDSYTVTELRTAANASSSTMLEFPFSIDDATAGTVVDLGSKPNEIVTIGTVLATDAGTHYAPAVGSVVLTDTISYTNLESGATYWFEGKLVDKATGESIGVTATGDTFIPEEPEGTATMTYMIEDAAILEGKTIVCFETLHREDDEGFAVVHEDIDDVAQTVYFPEIGTTLTGAEGSHEVLAAENVTLTDTVAYTSLEPGKSYTVTGELMDRESGEPTGITASTVFTPEETNGTVEVSFEFKGVAVAGKTVVAFETVEHEGRIWAVHADIEDDAQTISFPSISTTFVDREGEHESAVVDEIVILTDTVEYRNLIPGKEYVLNAELVDKDTEEVLATGTAAFTPEEPSGTVDVTIEVALADVKGKVTVCFETLERECRAVAVHADIEDAGQTVNFPDACTTLTDTEGNQEVLAAETVALTDTVAYSGLNVGKTYTVTGELFDKKSGESTGIVSEPVEFTPEESSGTVEVVFNFPGVEWAGHGLVAFETVSRDGRALAVHADIDDASQTVTIPKIGTTLADSDGAKDVASEGPIILVDTVEFENLVPGKPYTVTGELMDKATGESLGISASVPLVPEEVNGTVEVAFEVADASVLAGRTVVAFEVVKQDGREVAIHADIEDEAQTVRFPEIRTTATGDNGTKRVLATSSATITDTVTYTNLVPGKEYTMVGELHVRNADGSDGGALTVGGKPVTSMAKFTPEAPDGTVVMTFTFDASALSGRSVVVFESCYGGEKLIASHADIADASQTVEVYSIPVTGDMSGIGLAAWVAAVGTAVFLLGAFLMLKRKETGIR